MLSNRDSDRPQARNLIKNPLKVTFFETGPPQCRPHKNGPGSKLGRIVGDSTAIDPHVEYLGVLVRPRAGLEDIV